MLKQIKGFPNYFIDEEGSVYSIKSKKFLKPGVDKDGYLQVSLYNNGKVSSKRIHRLVALAFIPKTNEDIELDRDCVDHIDGCRTNNHTKNLRWCTVKENNNFESYRKNSSKAMLGNEHGKQCRIVINNNEYKSIREASKKLHIPHSTLWDRLNNPNFKDYKYKGD